MSARFQALVFDLGGVIVQHDNAMLFERLASRCSRSWGLEEVSARLRQGGWGTGTPIRHFYDQLKAEGGYDAPWSVFLDDWCCHLVLDPSMLALLGRLARHNRIVIFSNTNQEHWDFILRASNGELAGYEAYLSHLIGHEKPSLRSFQIVAERAGIDPARSIFFDDMPVNVDGARQAGFQAEVFLGEQWLLGHLQEHGVLVE
ncbi:HAD family hydrolase [Bradyrhizobium sp. 2TAF24]|uniref:HAD family hydrolase n=1 Tax=Bradyrhizobium sp. 2TAF24 TaxID=3233011 RepID=UPI003F927BC8